MQALGRMRQQVPVLVNRAPLHRHAIPDGGNRLVRLMFRPEGAKAGCAFDWKRYPRIAEA
jgi:hypothetical protein